MLLADVVIGARDTASEMAPPVLNRIAMCGPPYILTRPMLNYSMVKDYRPNGCAQGAYGTLRRWGIRG